MDDPLSISKPRVVLGVLTLGAVLILNACQPWDGVGVGGHPLTIELSPDQATLDVGDAQLLTASVRNRWHKPVGTWLTWSSADPAVASVDPQGRVRALSPGTTTITAAARTSTGSAEITVREPAPLAVIHFPLDGTALDASGNGRDGTVTGGVTPATGARGAAATAMYFDGTGGYIEFGNLDLPGAFSLAAWIRPSAHDDGGLRGSIVGKFTIPGNWELNVNESSSQIVAHTSTTVGLFSPAPVVADTWVHVVTTYDGVSTLSIYLDGVLATSGSGFAPAPSSPGLPRIGRSTWGGNPFKGAIDDVRVYDVELTPAEVATLFTVAGS